jgi:hypothetical protein
MEVEYELEAMDHKAFQNYHYLYGPRLTPPHPISPYWTRLGFFLLSGLLALGVNILRIFWKTVVIDDIVYPGVAVAVLVFMLGILSYHYVWMYNQLYKKTPPPTHLRLSLTPKGIRIDNPKIESLTYWSGIVAVGATNDYLFLYISPTSSYTVPRRAFPDLNSFHAFVDEAYRYVESDSAAREAGATRPTAENPTGKGIRAGDIRTRRLD